MAGVRDPAFWKRFSVAVHMDEEKQGEKQLKDEFVAPSSSKLDQNTYTNPTLQRLLASTTKQQKENAHTNLLGLLDRLPPARGGRCGSDHLAGGEWGFEQYWA